MSEAVMQRLAEVEKKNENISGKVDVILAFNVLVIILQLVTN